MKIKYSIFVISILLFLFSCEEEKEKTPTKLFSTPPSTILTPLTKIDATVNESSGLAFINNKLWTHNDSGNPPHLFQLDIKQPVLTQTKVLHDAINIDWEELAIDDSTLFIGDFGNNGGNRQDLKIYLVPLENFDHDTLKYQKAISFKYEDQNRFDHESYQHNFDCEGMISLNDQLYLFSKNHLNTQSSIYQIAKNDQSGIATKKATFNTKGVITAADLSSDEKVLALLGYKYLEGDIFKSFLWLFYNFEGDDFFGGEHQFIDLLLEEQAEGVVIQDQRLLLISTEAEKGGQGGLWNLDIAGYLK